MKKGMASKKKGARPIFYFRCTSVAFRGVDKGVGVRGGQGGVPVGVVATGVGESRPE